MKDFITSTGADFIEMLLDGWDSALEILIIVMLLDYLTGVVAAYRTKTLSSSVGYYGLVKKASIFIVVILAAQLDRIIGGENHLFRNCTAMSFTVNDAISILENAGNMGLKLPVFLKRALIKLDEQNENHVSDNVDQISKIVPSITDVSEDEMDHREPPTSMSD